MASETPQYPSGSLLNINPEFEDKYFHRLTKNKMTPVDKNYERPGMYVFLIYFSVSVVTEACFINNSPSLYSTFIDFSY